MPYLRAALFAAAMQTVLPLGKWSVGVPMARGMKRGMAKVGRGSRERMPCRQRMLSFTLLVQSATPGRLLHMHAWGLPPCLDAAALPPAGARAWVGLRQGLQPRGQGGRWAALSPCLLGSRGGRADGRVW